MRLDEVLSLLEGQLVHHPRYPGGSNVEVARALGVPLKCVIKCLIVKNLKDSSYVSCVIPGDRRLNMRRLGELLGVGRKRLRLALPSEVEALGYKPGHIPPTVILDLGRGYCDEEVVSLEYVIAGSGTPYYGVKFNPCKLLELGYAVSHIAEKRGPV